MNEGTISLALNAKRHVAEVIVECVCGALAFRTLEQAWRERKVRCPDCASDAMIDAEVLATLRLQAMLAQVTLDRLMAEA